MQRLHTQSAPAQPSLALDPVERQIYGSALLSRYQDRYTLEHHVRSLIEVYRRVLNG